MIWIALSRASFLEKLHCDFRVKQVGYIVYVDEFDECVRYISHLAIPLGHRVDTTPFSFLIIIRLGWEKYFWMNNLPWNPWKFKPKIINNKKYNMTHWSIIVFWSWLFKMLNRERKTKNKIHFTNYEGHRHGKLSRFKRAEFS